VSDRTALLIYCSQEQVEKIRTVAELQHRTVSGYVLNIVMRAVTFEETLYAGSDTRITKPALTQPVPLSPGPRSTMLLRCSTEEASRIRSAAKQRQTSISAFVRHVLKRSWDVTDGIMVRDQMEEVLAGKSAGHAPGGLYPPPSRELLLRRPE